MKRKKIITMFILLASSLFAFSSTANTKATASSSLHFSIPEGANLSQTMLIDVSSVHIINEKAGQKLASAICNNLLNFKYVDLNTFSLNLNQSPNSQIQSIQDWNKYISTVFPQMEKMLIAINN